MALSMCLNVFMLEKYFLRVSRATPKSILSLINTTTKNSTQPIEIYAINKPWPHYHFHYKFDEILSLRRDTPLTAMETRRQEFHLRVGGSVTDCHPLMLPSGFLNLHRRDISSQLVTAGGEPHWCQFILING